MKIRFLLLIALIGLFVNGCTKTSDQSTADTGQKQFDPSQSDPQAIRLADEIMLALGGRENYAAIKYLSFHFIVQADTQKLSEWRHDWDRRNNNYRLEGTTRDGEHILAVFNLATKKGAVFKNGQMLEGEDKIQWLSRAYARHINDTYWLLMPYKLKDPGARLQYGGTQAVAGIDYDVLKVSFVDSVGLTPWNIYHVFVDPVTRLVHRWEYIEREGAEPSPAWWENWRNYGGIKLAELRTFETSNRKILFQNIVASREVDEKIFEVAAPSTAKMP